MLKTAIPTRNLVLFGIVACLFAYTGFVQSWNTSLQILTMGLLSAIMAMGVNMQWGYAGLFSTGIVGSVALGGLAVVLVSADRDAAAWQAGGPSLLFALLIGVAAIGLAIAVYNRMKPGRMRGLTVSACIILGFFLYRYLFDAASVAIEANDPATHGNIGGLGLNSLVAWPVGGLLAAIAAWAIGKVALGLREDYLAIATLGIAEIVITAMKSEDWLARGVKNVIGLPRPWPVPYEVDLQKDPGFLSFVSNWGLDPISTSTILVKLMYVVMFTMVLLLIVFLSERALNSPWGRMMRAIRDNEVSASAMGKDVKARHLQIFIIGSAVVGIAGAMMTSMDGQLTPGTYSPLRFTFLIWIMVIVGGSGNNWGAVLGGLLMGWLWLIAENAGSLFQNYIGVFLADGPLKTHLIDIAPQMRLPLLGIALLLVLRFSPRGLIPEK